MLKILHTSDLHLGKKLFKVDRLHEQEKFLNWLVQISKQEKIDVLIIAGDIFDTPSPSHDAVKIYFSFLNKMSELENTQTLIIAGNHDSRSFIQAPNEILAKNNIRVWGELMSNPLEHKYSIRKDNENYVFYALPYFRSVDFLKWHQYYFNDAIPSNDSEREEAFLNTLEQFLKTSKDEKNIFIGHHLFGPYSLAGSEQAISLSGLDSIPISFFEGFDYMALGHIHKYQKISNSIPAYYSGSPYPLRFSERQQKKINVITFSNETCDITPIEIPQTRKLYELNTTAKTIDRDLDVFLEAEEKNEFSNFIAINVTVTEPTAGLSDFVRAKLKNSQTELIYLKNVLKNESTLAIPSLNNDLTIEELFSEYYQSKFDNTKIPKKVLNEFHKLLLEKAGHEI